MGTIGKINKSLIRNIFAKEVKKRTTPYGSVDYPSDEEMIEKLPVEMWDTWEGSDSEIKNYIHDLRMNWGEKKLGKVI